MAGRPEDDELPESITLIRVSASRRSESARVALGSWAEFGTNSSFKPGIFQRVCRCRYSEVFAA